MRSLVLIRDVRRQFPLGEPSASSASSATPPPPSGSALAIDPVHGTGYVLLGAEGRLLACDPEEGGVVVWAADLNAAVDEGEDEEAPAASGAAATAVRVHG